MVSDDLRNRVARAICEAMNPPANFDIEMLLSHDKTRERYTRYADAALAEIGGVRVKPLEWVTITPGFYEKAERFGMMYGVTRARDGNGWIADASPCWSSERDTAKVDARDLAFDWCEDHNRNRILAAIEPAPVSLREAARVLLDAWSQETVKGCQIRCVVEQARRDESIAGLKFSAALRAIAEGKDDG